MVSKPIKIKRHTNDLIWQGTAYNARGQATSYNLGSQYQVVREYDAWGFPKRIKTMKSGNPSEIENLYYTFDFKRGNLTQRGTLKYYRWDIFTYDALDRLNTETETISGNALATSYADNGNILTRSDVGTYGYSLTNAGPHAVTGITDATGTQLPQQNQSVSYTAFNKASHISQGTKDYFITYGSDRLRRRTSLHNDMADDALMTKYYAFGDFEQETDATGTRQIHYISGGDGLAAVYVKNENAADSLYFIMKDHLGSITGAINKETGKVYRQNFDAWGRKRNPQTWTYDDIPEYFPLSRGYTGHEHLDKFDLINMNGRMYDASLCRFLSPDPFVQMPDNSQNFNRYSYALNNPLVFTDPDGRFVVTAFLIGLAVTAAIDYGMQVAMNYASGYSGKDAWVNKVDFFDVAVSGAIGGLTGGFGASLKAGQVVGKFGTFMASNSAWVKAGEIAVTSAIDITGEGWQDVTFDQFGQRVAIAGATWGASEALNKYVFKTNSTSISPEQKVDDAIAIAKDNTTINHKGDLNEYLKKKEWTLSEIQETIEFGKAIEHDAPNYLNPGNRLISVCLLTLYC
ncbi:MAG: RHS repeat-associated core domain-containing protein [Bacteroidales bacterium]|nr:RHS repeat-associated core domain-containing protein [Bacteroidales bacterium]